MMNYAIHLSQGTGQYTINAGVRDNVDAGAPLLLVVGVGAMSTNRPRDSHFGLKLDSILACASVENVEKEGLSTDDVFGV